MIFSPEYIKNVFAIKCMNMVLAASHSKVDLNWVKEKKRRGNDSAEIERDRERERELGVRLLEAGKESGMGKNKSTEDKMKGGGVKERR